MLLCACFIGGCCGLVGFTELSLSRGGLHLGYFWSCTAGRPVHELPSDCGIGLWYGSNSWTLRGVQRKLDADHANHRAPRELAGGLARPKSSAGQRSASRTREERQFSASHGGQDIEGTAGRDLYCWRFV